MVMADMKEHAKERVVGSNLFIVIIHGDYFANVDQTPTYRSTSSDNSGNGNVNQ